MAEPGKSTQLISPLGGAIEASADEAAELLRQGYRPPTLEEQQANELQKSHGGALGMAGAAGAGALQGLTLGYGMPALITATEAADPAMAARMRSNFQRDVQANPNLAGGAELGGMALGAYLTRGGAAVAGEALAARAGLKKMGQMAAGGAFEGALYGGGEQLTHQVVRNQELDGEALARGAIEGGVLGGGFSLGLSGIGRAAAKGYGAGKGGLGRLFKKVDAGDIDAAVGRQVGGKAAPGVGAAVKGAVDDSSWLMKAATIAAKGDKAKARALYKAAATTEGREALLKSPALMKKYGDDLFGGMERMQANGDKASRAYSRMGKSEQVAKQVRRGSDDEIVAAVVGHLDEKIAEVQNMMADAAQYGSGRTQGWMKKQVGHYNNARKRIETAMRNGNDVPTTAFMALDEAKRKAQKKAFKQKTDDVVEDMVLDTFLDLEGSSRKFLERKDVWGAVADAQKNVNHPWSRRIQDGTEDEFFRHFLEMDKRGAKRFHKPRVSRTKVDTYLRGLNDAGTSPAHKALVNERRNLQAHVDAVQSDLILTPADKAQLAETRGIIKEMDGLIESAEEHVVGVNQLAQIHEYGSANSLTGLASGVGAGAIVGGPIGAAVGAAIGIASNPQAAVMKLAAIEHYARKAGVTMDGKVGKLFAKTYKKARPAGAAIRRHAHIPLQMADRPGGDTRQQFHAKADRLQASAQGGADRARADLAGLNAADAGVVDAALGTRQRAQDYLMAHLPKGLDLPAGVMGERPEVSRTEAEEWLRRADAVEDPMSVLDDLAKGTLSHEAVDALKEVYPATYEQLQSTVMDQMAEAAADGKTLPYGERIQLGVLLDVPTDPTLDPELMLGVQSLIGQDEQQKQAGAQPGGVDPHPKKAPDIAGAFRTGSEKLEASDEG